ncbi:hypothetical protein PC9H_011359 [Pleurotus ostreatus]|uniref:EthD domain-containing protein n=3 Tax=Pleurotus TaxID=5320 RepID=A0A067NKD6_PLEO1|nr:uncharacterized protein PC9H_011359 [Pleurotus ostreatus]KAF7420841.1 hypothetical protein PC9H_011359 [Pleurotus ostreatus]KAG9217917.1 hypothetical protein CCMSSC00406_0008558 [Pleurotus cornucopiae]KAJ8690281.1 hypothetical protein PTI98_011722 [Pleurotus ostreatus]KDQ24061.1 hypothetical protein PLEOSDRAFT_1090657 [Pleurotus ostreatus PC15]
MAIRVTLLLKRKPGMTRAQFNEYWGTHHARIFTGLKAVRANLVRYNQFHILPEESNCLANVGWRAAPYDGAADFFVEKLEDLLSLFGGEEYQKAAVPDEVQFLDRGSVEVLVGRDQVKYSKETP